MTSDKMFTFIAVGMCVLGAGYVVGEIIKIVVLSIVGGSP